MSRRIELTGRSFGNRIVLRRLHGSVWLCRCICGKESQHHTGTLTSGHANSCSNCLNKNRKGPLHPCWKGGRTLDGKSGYVKLWNNGKPRREHTLIAESILGRKLKPGEDVHHINGNKQDNRNANLLICTRSYHRWLENRMSDLYKKEHFS